jgi:hypothetical protein
MRTTCVLARQMLPGPCGLGTESIRSHSLGTLVHYLSPEESCLMLFQEERFCAREKGDQRR